MFMYFLIIKSVSLNAKFVNIRLIIVLSVLLQDITHLPALAIYSTLLKIRSVCLVKLYKIIIVNLAI